MKLPKLAFVLIIGSQVSTYLEGMSFIRKKRDALSGKNKRNVLPDAASNDMRTMISSEFASSIEPATIPSKKYPLLAALRKAYKDTNTDNDHLFKALKKVNVDVSSEQIFACDVLASGNILGRPLGEITIDLLALSEETNDSYYENIAELLCMRFIEDLYEYFSKKRRFLKKITMIDPQKIAQIDPSRINQKGLSGRTFLMIILSNHPYNTDHPDVIEYIKQLIKELLENSANGTLQDRNGETPLHLAVSLLNIGVCELLIESGASLDIIDSTGTIPLHCFYKSQRILRKQLVIRNDPETSSSGGTSQESHIFLNICRLFHKKQYDFNTKDGFGETLLHKAFCKDYSLSTYLLLKRRVFEDEPDRFGQTPLHRAYVEQAIFYLGLLKKVKKAPQSKDLFGNTPFIYASASKSLLSDASNNVAHDFFEPNSAGWTPIHVAAYYNNIKGAKSLISILKNEADVSRLINCTIKCSGKTALMIACERGFTDFCDLLTSYSCLIKNARDTLVGSALDWAFEFEQVEIAAMLFRNGFNDGLSEEDKARLMQRASWAEPTNQRLLREIFNRADYIMTYQKTLRAHEKSLDSDTE